MKLFISKGLWKYRNYQIKLEKVDDKRTKLIICNLQNSEDNEEKYKNIEFTIPATIIDLMTWSDYETSSSKLRKTANGYIFEPAVSNNNKVAYALLHYGRVIPSDIYVPVSMKKHIEVLEKIQFYDVEPDYGEYLAKIYFVKITIPKDETIPFYLSWRDNFKYLEDHLIFTNNMCHEINVRTGRTKIRLDSLKRKEYISLSDL